MEIEIENFVLSKRLIINEVPFFVNVDLTVNEEMKLIRTKVEVIGTKLDYTNWQPVNTDFILEIIEEMTRYDLENNEELKKLIEKKIEEQGN